MSYDHDEKFHVYNCVEFSQNPHSNRAISRGMCLLTSIMTPKDGTPLRAVVCYCHGFLGSASLLARCEYQRFVKAGIAVVSTEYEGHGRSDGLLGLVPCWNKLIDDTSNFFEETCKRRFSGLPCFLNGEVRKIAFVFILILSLIIFLFDSYFLFYQSMGGAVAFSTYERNPKMWNGVIFVAPMVKIADDVVSSSVNALSNALDLFNCCLS